MDVPQLVPVPQTIDGRVACAYCFFQCIYASQVGQHFSLPPNFELLKRRRYPIIPTGMRSNIKGRWQPGPQ